MTQHGREETRFFHREKERSVYDELLEERSFRFPPAIEQAFRLDFLRGERLRTRIGVWAGLSLFVAYAIWDMLSFPDAFWRWTVPMRLVFVCPLYAAVILASHFRERVGLMDSLRTSAMMVSGLCVALITVLAQRYDITAGPEGLFLLIVAAYTLTGLRTVHATICGVSMMAMQIGLALWFDYAGRFGDAIVFSGTANLIGFVACATHERASRENFLRTRILDHMASEDGLTGLPNRRYIEAHLAHVFRLAARSQLAVALAMVDVDHFKELNDRLGHSAGDSCLVRVGHALRRLARRPLDATARIGGEEFLVVWFDVAPGASEALAKGIRRKIEDLAIEQPTRPGENLTVSAGIVSLTPTSERDPGEVIVRADEALYEAKAAGRDRVRIVEM